MERIKRAVSLILCFVMVFGLLPMHAFAATGTLEDSTVVTYQRVDQLTSGKQYLIVNRNSAGNGYALGSSTAGVSVTVGNNGVISDKRTALEWTATGSGSSWKFSSGSYKLGVTVGGSFANRSFTLNTGTDSSWTYSRSSSYSRLSFTFDTTIYDYVRYLYCSSNGTWGVQQTQSNVYFYERTETPVTGAEVDFTVSPESLELQGGESQVLTPSVLVAGAAASGYEITWESSDSNVATVGTDGTVTGVSNGDATIIATLTAANGTAMKENIVVTIPVSVKTVTLSRIEVSGADGITTCMHKDADFTNVTVKAIYSDGTEVTLTEGVTFTYEKAVGQQTVTATFEGKTATFPITVEEETAAGQLVGTTSFTFFQNTAEDFSGLSCVLTYPCGHSENVAADKLTISGYNISEIGTYENCPVSYNGTIVGSVTVNVVERTSTFVEGTLKGEKKYTLDTDGIINEDKAYLIVNSSSNGTRYALTNDSGVGTTSVTVSNNTITVKDDSKIAWTFTASNGGYLISNNGVSIYPNDGSLSLWADGTALSVSNRGSGAYRIYRPGSNRTYYYVRYDNGWTGSTSSSNSNVYLYYEDGYGSGTGEKVTFTLNQSVIMVRPGETETLTGNVKVGNTEYDLSKCEIDWTITPDGFATVEGGVVKGITDGTATVTATLKSVNGRELSEPISLDVKVTVKSRALVSAKLEGNDPVTTKLGVEPDFSKIKLTVGYEDGTSAVITTANGLVIEGYEIDEIGFYYATISYGGKEYGTVRVTVDGNPYEGKDPATDYPKYPEDGAVRIDKTAEELDFQTSGLVQVELDVAGVSIKKAVDVVLTIDISNSMAWKTGTREDEFENKNKLDEVMDAVKTFANILLADNDDGTPTRNTITIVTFAGKDSENWNNEDNYSDSVRTLVTGTSSLEVINAIADNSKFVGKITINGTNDYGLQLGYIPADADQNDVSNVVVTDPFLNRGDTNYDYGFWQTSKAITDGKLGGSGRDIYVLFMTDGCPSNYNGVYYRSKNVGHAFKPGTKETYTYYAASNGTAWTNHVKNTLIAQNGGNIYAKALYEQVTGIYAVGFDMAHGSFAGISTWSSTEDWEAVFNDIVSKSVVDAKGNGLIPVTPASDTIKLNSFYESMGRALRNAGTYANVTDIVDPDFTLQMSNQAGTEGQGAGLYDLEAKGYSTEITVKLYDLWTKAETTDTTLIGTRKVNEETGKEIFEAVETVTFSADGTAAYSSLINGGSTNIMSVVNGTTTIAAHYFTYTKTPEGVETFKWEIGTITDKEIALSYMAYLKGSREGKEPNGLKYTNQEAILEYIDINDKYAQQIFPRPAVAWGGASTAYEFYLVNEQGQPCDRQGNEIPFANRIIITGPFFEELYLNQTGQEIAQEIIAVKVLPAGYTLYDETAMYTVKTASGNNKGNLTLSEPAAGKVQTTKVVSVVEPSYIQSRVAFGVMYNQIPTQSEFVIAPDRVVVDYGKPIVIDVNTNNTDIPKNVTAEFIGFSKFYDNVDVTQQFSNTPYSTPFDGLYGTFSINSDGNVLYTPTKLINNIGKVFCVYKITESDTHDIYYMVSELDVIPATVVYYETDFVLKQINENNSDTLKDVFAYSSNWEAAQTDSIAADGPQDDGTIGGNTYGFDTSYNNDAKLSDHSSQFAKGQGYTTTNVTFSFTGTGFDLISRTGTEQGLIQVQVATDAKFSNIIKTVTVLNKSESNLELYQIPVASINGLEHGTYYVKIGVNMAFTTTIEALKPLIRGNEFYFDAIRIYDPAKGNELAEAAYNADGEANSVITEVRQQLISADTFEEIPSGSSTEGVVFVDRTYTEGGIDLEVGNVNVSDYAAVGPNNELYLSQGQAVAFKMKSNLIPASFDVGAKSVTGEAAHLKVTVTPGAGSPNAWTVEADIASSTVQFINLLTENAKTSVFTRDVYVIITNTGAGVLSITDIKTAFSIASGATTVVEQNNVQSGNGASLSVMGIIPPASIVTTAASVIADMEDPFAVSFSVDAGTLAVTRSVLTASEDEQPEEPIDPSEPEVDTSMYDIIRAYVKKTGVKKNVKYTITVVTTQEVEEITVSQGTEELKPSKISYKDNKKNGTREWTIVLSSRVSELYDFFTLIGAGEDGTTGEAFNVTKPR